MRFDITLKKTAKFESNIYGIQIRFDLDIFKHILAHTPFFIPSISLCM